MSSLPEVIIHGLEEKFVVGFIEDIFEVRESDSIRRNRQFDQVGSFLIIEVVDNFGLPHGRPLGSVRPCSSSAESHSQPP